MLSKPALEIDQLLLIKSNRWEVSEAQSNSFALILTELENWAPIILNLCTGSVTDLEETR